MIEGFDAATLTAPALVGIAVLLVLLGLIYPRRYVTELRKDKDAQIDDWKAAYATSEEARLLQTKQLDEMLELTRTMHAIVAALPKVES